MVKLPCLYEDYILVEKIVIEQVRKIRKKGTLMNSMKEMGIFIQIDFECLSTVLGPGNLVVHKIVKVHMLLDLISFPVSEELRALRRK